MSNDVVSQFTKTPVKETYEVIRERLENDKTLKKRTNLKVDNIIELLNNIIELLNNIIELLNNIIELLKKWW